MLIIDNPDFLYHYYPLRLGSRRADLDRIIDVIVNHRVFFSSISMFNDPYECRPVYIAPEDGFEEWFKRVKSGGRWQSDEVARVESNYRNGQVTAKNLCDHLKVSFIKNIEEKIGVYCLSEKNDNLLMWSHYSSSHTGVCLKFLASSNTPFFGEALKVNYPDSELRPVVDIFAPWGMGATEATFLTKSQDWSYECEFRIVGDKRPPRKIDSFPHDLLKGVILGAKIRSEDSIEIIEAMRRVGINIPLFRAELSSTKYCMDII